MNRNRPIYRSEPTAPKWLRRWLGDELFQSVKRVSFPKPVTPDQVANVARFDGLEALTLSDATRIGDGLRHLRGSSQLHELWITPPGVTDAVLADIAELASIRKLTFIKTIMTVPTVNAPATDAGFIRLAKLANLETLEIKESTNLTDSGAARMVEGMPRLQDLLLSNGLASVAVTLPTVARLHPDLRFLGLDFSGVTDDDLKSVEGMTRLQHLILGRTAITDAGLAHIRPLKNLISLSIYDTKITDEGMKTLGQLTLLNHLQMGKTQLTDAGLVSLEKLANLKQLYISSSAISDAGMSSVAKFANLERLDVNEIPRLTDEGLVPLANLKKLNHLSVVDTKVTPEGLAILRRALPALRPVTTRRSPLPATKPTPPK